MSISQACTGYVKTKDHGLMRRINKWRAPRWFRLWMICATRSGDGWLWYALLGAVWLLGGPIGARAIRTCSCAVATGVVTFLALKRTARRRRPCHLEPHIWSTVSPPDQFSFPSGHTTTAFAVAVPLGDLYSAWAPAMYFIAISIALSRVVLGMHFLSDVIAGAVIGGLLGYVFLALG